MDLKYDFDDDEEFVYEVDDEAAFNWALTCFAERYEIPEEQAQKIVSDWDLDIKQEFAEDIRCYFADDAREAYDDSRDYDRDPLGHYGLRQSDFL